MPRLSNMTDYSNATGDISLDCEDHQEIIIFWICSIVVLFVLGFPGVVTLLLHMFQKERKGTPFTPHDVFMLNLTVMDGLYLLSLLPELYNYLHWNNAGFDVFIRFLFSFHLCGRPLFLVCISLDCYLAVVHPVTYWARKSLTPRILIAVGVWTVTAASGYYFTTTDAHVLIDRAPAFSFSLTLPVIGFCDFSILWTLKRSNPGGGDVHPQKKKALQIIINNLIIIIISYFPPIVTLLVSQFLSLDEATIFCLVVVPVMYITVLGNAVSPILHLNNLGKLDWLKCWKQK